MPVLPAGHVHRGHVTTHVAPPRNPLGQQRVGVWSWRSRSRDTLTAVSRGLTLRQELIETYYLDVPQLSAQRGYGEQLTDEGWGVCHGACEETCR